MTSGIYFYNLHIIWTLNNQICVFALMHNETLILSKAAQVLNIQKVFKILYHYKIY